MNIRFNKVKIHHFLSFGDAEIDLRDRGYCLVSGVNRNPKDAAKSNGSGKSTIWSAISFALTGETIGGIKSNLANIYFDDGCWVSLEFEVDGKTYVVTRSKDDVKLGTNLKIVVDGEDKSGKGINESREILDQLLPDVTTELLGSVIILGQGLPQKFTSNKPSGRKEVLEHLSKSDFMIQDLKERVEARGSIVGRMVRENEDKTLSGTSKKSLYEQTLTRLGTELEEAEKPVEYDSTIKDLTEKIKANEESEKAKSDLVTAKSAELDGLEKEYYSIGERKQAALTEMETNHLEYSKELNSKRQDVSNRKFSLEAEIRKMKSITDVCPTCGQKIPNVIKPDTTALEEELKTVVESLNKIDSEIAEDAREYRDAINGINDKFNEMTSGLKGKIDALKAETFNIQGEIRMILSSKSLLERDLASTKAAKENHESNINRLKKEISETKESLDSLNNELNVLAEEHASLKKHQEVLDKMSTMLRRNFRGYLLTGVIDYINSRAKEYSSQIFGSDEIEFELDGNNINISYLKKDYENLSGGEKQRVDLIVQFALRDMMCKYLGFSSNILVLDEITDALDSTSCDRVLNFITKELGGIESVFIISHHSDELEIPCDSELTVEKNESGVSSVK